MLSSLCLTFTTYTWCAVYVSIMLIAYMLPRIFMRKHAKQLVKYVKSIPIEALELHVSKCALVCI